MCCHLQRVVPATMSSDAAALFVVEDVCESSDKEGHTADGDSDGATPGTGPVLWTCVDDG